MSEAAVHFIYGSDDYLVGEAAKKVFAKYAKSPEDPFACEVIDGYVQVVGDVEGVRNRFLGAVQTQGFLSEDKTVWLKGVNFLADSVVGKSETTKESVEAIVEAVGKVGEGIIVIISASPVDKRTKGFKALEKACKSVSVDSKEGPDPKALARKRFEELGVEVKSGALELLGQKVGGNSRMLFSEVEKLSVYAGSETVDERMVLDLVPDSAEADFFEVPEAFFAKDLKWTLEAIERYFFNNKDTRPLLASMQNRLRLLIQLKALGRTQGLDDLVSVYGYMGGKEKSAFNVGSQNPWYLKRLAGSLGKFSLKELVGIQKSLVGYFEGILAQPDDQAGLFKRFTLKHLS